MSKMSAECGIPDGALAAAMDTVGEWYGGDRMAPLDTPLTTEEIWASQVQDVLASRGIVADLSRFGDKWFSGRPANAEWLSFLHRLKNAGYVVGMLSNMVPSWDRLWREMVPRADALFDHTVFSFSCGYRKPEATIFALAAGRCGLPPASCVLVDDLAANCAGARVAGWHAVEFSDAMQAAAELTAVLADLGDLADLAGVAGAAGAAGLAGVAGAAGLARVAGGQPGPGLGCPP